MPNYFTDLIWAVDKTLLGFAILAGLLTIFYALAKEYRWKKRSRALLNIKRNVYELALSGKKIDSNGCLLIVSKISPQQFLDVATNRNREVAFFNESEQKIIKDCFVSTVKLAEIEKIAASSWNKWQRIEAILSLGYAQSPASVNALKKAISVRDSDIAYFSIIALGQIKNIASAKILLDFVKKRTFYHYRIFSLLESFPPETADAVIGLTANPDSGLRSWAVKLICRFKAWQYCEKIEELTKDESAQVRASACDCLGEFGRKSSADAIVKCLTDDSWMVRVSAVKSLFKVSGKEGLPKIMARINDGSLSVIESVKALITANIETCLSYVVDFLYGDDEMARRIAVEALEASGHIVKLFRDILSGNKEDKETAEYLLKGLIVSCAYAGLEVSLLSLAADEQKKILGIIKNIDEATADILERNIAGHKT
jgi:hypothetical protein